MKPFGKKVRQGSEGVTTWVSSTPSLALLKQEKTAKVGVKAKRLVAGWDGKYLLRMLRI